MIKRFCIRWLEKRGWLIAELFDGEEAIVLYKTNHKTVFYDRGGEKWIAYRK